MKKNFDFLIIGGGIIGLTVARSIRSLFPSSSLAVLEKELLCGQHASTNNSGVVHAGFYYTPGSLKAMITRKGNQYMSEYCQENHVGFKRTGKFLVPKNAADVSNLKNFVEKGIKNGVICEIITKQEAKEIEPNLACKYDKIFYSPLTAIADQTALIQTLVKELKSKNIEIMTDTKFLDCLPPRRILTNKGPLEYGYFKKFFSPKPYN
jgi:L-2-hydroxyglutarate oxidase